MFVVIDDMAQADALWNAGLLWCREKTPSESDWDDWWLYSADVHEYDDLYRPSVYTPTRGHKIQYAIQLEE